VVGEVDRVPFATGSTGAVLAMHMLYHATDPRGALAELRRVLRPGGRLVVSTNASDDKTEMGQLWHDSLCDLGVAQPPDYPYQDRRFSLEVAVELVGDVFGAYELSDFHSQVAVPDPDVVLAYVDSTREAHRRLPDGITWAKFLAAARRRIRAQVETAGAFALHSHVGVVTATA